MDSKTSAQVLRGQLRLPSHGRTDHDMSDVCAYMLRIKGSALLYGQILYSSVSIMRCFGCAHALTYLIVHACSLTLCNEVAMNGSMHGRFMCLLCLVALSKQNASGNFTFGSKNVSLIERIFLKPINSENSYADEFNFTPQTTSLRLNYVYQYTKDDVCEDDTKIQIVPQGQVDTILYSHSIHNTSIRH